MSQYWDYYLVRVNEKPASIFVDMGERDSSPNPALTRLHWVWVSLKLPYEQGLVTRAERPVLNAIEDALTMECRQVGAHYVGRVITDGRIELYFYAPDNSPVAAAVEMAMDGFADYDYEYGEKEDSSWSHYRDFLYPDIDERQTMANRKVLWQLQQEGDLPDVPRTMRHWVYFRKASHRDDFAICASSHGFTFVPPAPNEQTGRYAALLTRTEPADPVTIDRSVLELLRLAIEFDGEYGGWESPVVTRDPSKPTLWEQIVRRFARKR